MWFIPFLSTYSVSFGPLGVGYKATRVFDSGWIEFLLVELDPILYQHLF